MTDENPQHPSDAGRSIADHAQCAAYVAGGALLWWFVPVVFWILVFVALAIGGVMAAGFALWAAFDWAVPRIQRNAQRFGRYAALRRSKRTSTGDAYQRARRAERRSRIKAMFSVLAIALFAVAIWTATIGGIVLLVKAGDRRFNDRQLVDVYCSYGVRSEAQYDGCLDHVTADDVRSRNSEAAKFANGTKKTCGSGSGPFCEDYPYGTAD